MRKSFLISFCCLIALALLSTQAEAKWGKDKTEPNKEAEVKIAAKSAISTRSQKIKPQEIKLDRDHDGVIDKVETYTVDGIIVKSETDTNGDSKIDEWVFYENGKPVKAKKDTNRDGKADTWLKY